MKQRHFHIRSIFPWNKNQIYRFWFILFWILFVSGIQIHAQKRGLAYGHHWPEDLEQLSPQVTWWYNWAESPEASVADVYEQYGFEFVPMTWNGNFSETKLVQFLENHPETKYLLAFNEPNFLDQANLTPTQAATIWPKLEAIADTYNLKIVGPAGNYCGNCVTENGIQYTDPVQYLDDFFAACPNCRVDYIAVHCYMGTLSALKWYISLFKKYNKPIWLTEFSSWDTDGFLRSPDDQIEFMTQAVEYLENEPSVFRYAWFIGRGAGYQNFPYNDLLAERGELTPVGEVYTQMPVHDTTYVIQLPSKIDAVNYIRKSGMQLQLNSVDAGFAHMRVAEADDFLEYKIQVPQTATYDFSIRVSSVSQTALRIFIDDEAILTQRISDTGGWENWTTLSQQMELTEGEHTLKLKALNKGFQINWFECKIANAQIITSHNISQLKLYPSPGNETLNIECTNGEVPTCEIFNLSGSRVIPQQQTLQVNISTLSAGLYVIKIWMDDQCFQRKIVKN